MSRKRNSNRKPMALLQSVVPCPSIAECDLEYFRPGCYCIPQVMPNGTSCTCAYLHEYVPQWRAACSTATYVVDTYGMVYYLSDFEHQLQLPNNMVQTEMAYHIPTHMDGHDCEINNEEYEGDAVSPRKRERFQIESDEEAVEEAFRASEQVSCHDSSTKKCMVDAQLKADIAEQGYYVEEPPDTENKVEQRQ